MTAPAGAAVARGELPVTYAVDGLTLGRHDRWGNYWIPQVTEGWYDPPAPRNKREARASGNGADRSPAWYDARTITITGKVKSPDVTARNRARQVFAALCADPNRLYELVGTDQDGQQLTCMVEREPSKFTVRNAQLVDFQLVVAAPDPRKHDVAWQNPLSSPPYGGQFGLDFSGPGLDFSGVGLDFGNPAQPETAKVGNYGTAPAAPVFTLTGPLTQPVVRHLESGRELGYDGDIAAGETVWINCDEFPQRGLLPHARMSSTRGNVGALIPIRAGWPTVDPGTAASFQLLALGGPGAGMRTSLRSAWY